MSPERRFECFVNFLGWWHWSIGLHVDVRHPHIDVHVPFGFCRVGWWRSPTIDRPRSFGYDGWRQQSYEWRHEPLVPLPHTESAAETRKEPANE